MKKYVLGYADPVVSSPKISRYPNFVSLLGRADSLLGKLQRWIDSFKKMDPSKEINPPIFSRTYTSFSGVDIKLYAQIFKTDESHITRRISEATGISYKETYATKQYPVTGTLLPLVWDEAILTDTDISSLNFVLKANNEFGQRAEMEILGVVLTERSGGIAVDDIILEERIDFKAEKLIPWHLINQ